MFLVPNLCPYVIKNYQNRSKNIKEYKKSNSLQFYDLNRILLYFNTLQNYTIKNTGLLTYRAVCLDVTPDKNVRPTCYLMRGRLRRSNSTKPKIIFTTTS